jgi:peroxiredoxin
MQTISIGLGLLIPFLAAPLTMAAHPRTTSGSDAKPPAAGLKLSYSGTLRETDPSADDRPLRSFRIHFLATEITPAGGCQLAWVLEEEAGTPRWMWAQRFGSVAFNKSLQATSDRETAAIQGERDGSVRVIPLKLPLWSAQDRLMPNARWEEGETRYEVMGRDQVGSRRCWKVGVSNRLGPSEVVWIDEQEPIVLRHRELVFLGQGVAHELALELEKTSTLSADELSRSTKSHTTLANLRGPLREKISELTETTVPANAELLQQARAASSDIQLALGTGTYVELARDVVRELQTAIERQGNLAKLSTEIVGKPAHDFSLQTARGEKISLADFKGKPVVLHFWEYRSEPKVAPYGETGYLDFVWRQRQKQGIGVVGIAVDGRLRDDATRAAARRDVRAFCEFMNLSFPVAFDDGTASVIEKYGDPRAAGGKLPLYVIIAPDGRVADYHSGHWSKSADEGLRELDERLRKLIP